MTEHATAGHPERIVVRRAIDERLHDLPVATNPLAIALNMRLASAREGGVRAIYTVPEHFAQGNGFVQGVSFPRCSISAWCLRRFPSCRPGRR
jgi:citrate lyase beta subunit